MPSTAFDDWVALFDEELSNAWKNEPNELIKLPVMLVLACKKEFKKITEAIDTELDSIRKKLKRRDQLQTRLKLSVSPPTTNRSPTQKNKNNIQGTINCQNVSVGDSPDLFENLEYSITLDSSTIKKSSEGEASMIESNLTSPTIKKKRRSYYSKVKNKDLNVVKNNTAVNKIEGKFDSPGIKQNLFKTPIAQNHNDSLDTSVIENTPEALPKMINSVMVSFKKKRKNVSKSSTLTQMFCNSRSEFPKVKCKKNEDYDSDITFIENNGDSKTNLEITDIIDLINNDDRKNDASPSLGTGFKLSNDKRSEGNVKSATVDEAETANWSRNLHDLIENGEMRANQETENMDATLKLPTSDLNEFLAKANNVPEHQLEQEEVTRGKARKNLPGWACKDCEKFYVNQDLTPGELVEKMNQCSKHRSRYKPRQETIPGFWDLTMSSQSQE